MLLAHDSIRTNIQNCTINCKIISLNTDHTAGRTSPMVISMATGTVTGLCSDMLGLEQSLTGLSSFAIISALGP